MKLMNLTLAAAVFAFCVNASNAAPDPFEGKPELRRQVAELCLGTGSVVGEAGLVVVAGILYSCALVVSIPGASQTITNMGANGINGIIP